LIVEPKKTPGLVLNSVAFSRRIDVPFDYIVNSRAEIKAGARRPIYRAIKRDGKRVYERQSGRGSGKAGGGDNMGKKHDAIEVIESIIGPSSFGETLRAHRRLLDMTQEEMGRKLGITGATVSDYESGRQVPSLARALEIGAAVGLFEEMVIQSIFVDALRAVGRPWVGVRVHEITPYRPKNRETAKALKGGVAKRTASRRAPVPRRG
jgi:transcriptional regulator with XRE-family HTH domain